MVNNKIYSVFPAFGMTIFLVNIIFHFYSQIIQTIQVEFGLHYISSIESPPINDFIILEGTNSLQK